MFRTSSLFSSLSLLLLAAPTRASAPTAPPDGVLDYAVLYFTTGNTEPDMQVLSKGFAQMLIADLSQHGGFRVVERDRIEELKAELKLGASGAVDPTTARKIGKLVGADLIVTGDYMKVGTTFVATVRVVDVETGVIGCAEKRVGRPDDFLRFETEFAQVLAPSLAAGGMKCVPTTPAVAASLPKVGTEVVADFSRALDAKDNHDPETAKALLQKVVAAQPEFTLAEEELRALMK